MPQLQFHWYGFFIGLAAVVGFSLAEFQAKKRNIPTNVFWSLVMWLLVGGLVGSRSWHVVTDFQFYRNDLWNIFAIWNGGLSILGSVAGALISFWLFFKKYPGWEKYKFTLLDVSVFGLPIAQAIGRLGNYANQELYGLPTNLIVGIKIDSAHRYSGFEQYSTYHPLFAYEAVLLLLFSIFVWVKQRSLQVGSGRIFWWYIAYYSWIRFSLDFLRIDKAASFVGGLGFNQVVLLVVAVLTTAYLLLPKAKEQT